MRSRKAFSMRCGRKTMFNTFRIALRLRIAYRINTIIYSLKQVPLLGDMLPSALYAAKGLKSFACICAVIWEFFSMLVKNGLYLIVLMFVPMQLLSLPYDAFAHIYFFLSIAGAVSNCYMFDPTKDKYYAIILMRMDARQYSISQHLYTIGRVFVGTQFVLLFLAANLQAPLWLCIIPFGVAGMKTLSVALSLRRFEKSGFVRNENAPEKISWTIIALCWLAAYAALPVKIFLPSALIVALAVLCVVGGSLLFPYLWRCSLYRPLAQQLLNQKNSAVSLNLNKITKESYQKKIDNDENISSNKKGCVYFNDLFVKRHRRMLWRYAKWLAAIIALLDIAAIVTLLYFPFLHQEAHEVAIQSLPYLTFLIYAFHSGKNVVQAMFHNCDHSMLTYSFYRRRDVVLSLFRCRLFDVIRINLLPAFVLAVGYAGILFVCDSSDLITCAVAAISILGISVLFSIHFLACYYLLQPYNAATETKSSTYGIVMGITYAVCYCFIYLRIDTFLFGLLMIIFSVVYGSITYYLVGRYALKTFRLRP